jgi:hypothetical protein
LERGGASRRTPNAYFTFVRFISKNFIQVVPSRENSISFHSPCRSGEWRSGSCAGTSSPTPRSVVADLELRLDASGGDIMKTGLSFSIEGTTATLMHHFSIDHRRSA